MENYREMHYSAYLQSDYHKYKSLFKKVIKYEYNPIMKYEILKIKDGKTIEDIRQIEKQIEEQENKQVRTNEEDEGNYFLHYYD